MRPSHLEYLACPRCHGDLDLEAVAVSGDRVERGNLSCRGCRASYPIERHIPRFVPIDNYASGFGLEWTKHARTQYDSDSGLRISERRFFDQTRWPRSLPNEILLEAGSGSGRFTEQAAATGAFVVSFDFSYAVEANYASNGRRPNVLIVQADILAMPFRASIFDKVVCFGVLQHTPDARASFLALARMLKPGGALTADIYKATLARVILSPKYVARWFTRRVRPDRLYVAVVRYVDFMWPICAAIRKIPRVGAQINWRLLVADYSGLGLDDARLKEWAYLDTFDMLAPRYDTPVRLPTFRHWFTEAGLANVEVEYSGHGIVGRGVHPSVAAARAPASDRPRADAV